VPDRGAAGQFSRKVWTCTSARPKIHAGRTAYVVTELPVVETGKGQAFTRTKMHNMHNGGTSSANIRSGEKLEPAMLKDRTLQFIYPEVMHRVLNSMTATKSPSGRRGGRRRWLHDDGTT